MYLAGFDQKLDLLVLTYLVCYCLKSAKLYTFLHLDGVEFLSSLLPACFTWDELSTEVAQVVFLLGIEMCQVQ